MTNREHMNTLPNEELAKVVTTIDEACEQQTDAGLCKNYKSCDDCKADWLGKERAEYERI